MSSGPAPRARAAGAAVRLLDGLAGLLGAGVLVVGILLLVAQLVAPALLAALGWGAATGPGWLRVAAHLVVGGAGELVVRLRSGWSGPARIAADAAVVLAALLVLGRAWWP